MTRSTRSSSWPRRRIKPVAADDAVGALLLLQLRILFDAVERHFRRAAKHRKHRAVFQKVDGVIAPFAGRDHAAIEIENAIEFAAVEGDLIEKIDGSGLVARRGAAPGELAWIDFAGTELMRRLLFSIVDDRAARARGQDLPAGIKDVPAGIETFPQALSTSKLGKKGRIFDHELVNSAHNNALFWSIAGHEALRYMDRCLKARSGDLRIPQPPSPPGVSRPGQFGSVELQVALDSIPNSNPQVFGPARRRPVFFMRSRE